MSNDRIWQLAQETDASAVKKSKVDGRNIASVNVASVFKKATEIFGPCGHGWGYEIKEERFDNAGMIFLKEEQTDGNGAQIIEAKIHTMLIEVWYKEGEQTCTVQQYGHTPYIYRSKYGFSVDSEYAKKTLSDGIKKALSGLGFNADIHLGLWDDQSYVNAISAQQNAESEAESSVELERQRADFTEWVKSQIDGIKELKVKNQAVGAQRIAIKEITKRCIAIKIDSEKWVSKLKADTQEHIGAL